MRKNSDIFEYFKDFKNMVRKKIRRHINILQSNQGENISQMNSSSAANLMELYNNT